MKVTVFKAILSGILTGSRNELSVTIEAPDYGVVYDTVTDIRDKLVNTKVLNGSNIAHDSTEIEVLD